MASCANILSLNARLNQNVIILFLSFFISFSSFGAVVTATSSGDWTSGGVWDTGSSPSCGDTIIISVGVTVDVNSQILLDNCPDPSFILIEGTLNFNTGKKIYMSAGSGVSVVGNGKITGGGGGGNSNLINIGGADVWSSGDGDVLTPVVIGEEFGVEIKSIASGDFNAITTWDCNCIPDSTKVATILAAHSVTISNQSYIFDITIEGSLEIQGSNDLYIRNSWVNNGLFVRNESSLSFGGVGGRSIGGSRNQTFHNIHVKNGCVLNNNMGLLNLEGILTFNNGTFNTNDSLYLISSANGTGAIGSLSLGSISGNVFSNRYIMSGATGWRFLTSCIQGATLEDVDDDIITAGIVGSDYPTFSFVSIYEYDESVPGNKDNGYLVPGSMSQSIGTGKGYWIYAGDNLSGTSAFNIDFYGSVNQGDLNLPVSYTNSGDSGDGWNLVANPYPCSINWDDANWTKTSISDETHIFNPNSGTYAVYAAGVGANGGSNIISSNQAFWVKATAASPELTVTEDCKINDNSDPFKSQSSFAQLKITCKKTVGSNFSDEIVLAFDESSSQIVSLASKFISTNDSVLNVMFDSGIGLSSIIRGGSIFETIPLRLNGNSNNTVISFEDLNFLQNYWSVYLVDNSNNDRYLISGNMDIDLNKSISNTNSDLSIVLVPRANITQSNPSCDLSNDGSIRSNVYGMDNYMNLMKISDSSQCSQTSSYWDSLSIDTYAFHITHPIDSSFHFDTIISLLPQTLSPYIISTSVLDRKSTLIVEETFLSCDWLINGHTVLRDENSIDLNDFESFLKKGDVNLIQCVFLDTIGCKNAYEWTFKLSSSELLFPNPLSENNSLSVFVQKGNNSVLFYNINGQLIQSFNLNSDNDSFVELKMLDLSQGQYIAIIKSEVSIDFLKLIVND